MAIFISLAILLLLVFCCLVGHWLLSLRHITDICLQLVSLLFHIPCICCSSTVVSFSLSYISQSSCLLECLSITHHVGEHAQGICVSVDLLCWWHSYFTWLDSKLQRYWLLLSSWSSPSFSFDSFHNCFRYCPCLDAYKTRLHTRHLTIHFLRSIFILLVKIFFLSMNFTFANPILLLISITVSIFYNQTSLAIYRAMLWNNYLRRRRRLCFWFGLFVCLSVCPSDYSQTCERILTKFYGGVGHGSRTKWYNFGGDLDHASDPGDQSPKSGYSGSAEVCALWA